MAARDDVEKAEKPRMCLSRETVEGLHITGIHKHNNYTGTLYMNTIFLQ